MGKENRFGVIAALIAGLLVFVVSGLVWAETGVKDDEIILGMSNPLTGPASALGTGLKAGAMVYFDKVNAQGGVHGRKIKVISYDDGYEPTETVKNTNKLINEDKVFALFGYVGTPTSKAIMPIIDKEKIIFFGPFTGAEFLRNPVNRYIFNVRSSYFNEAEAQVEYLTSKLGLKKIGVFMQDDAYGLAVKGGVVRALEKRKLPLAGEGKYKRNTEDVDEALSALKAANPEAVSMVGTYSAMAAFIKKARAGGFNPVFLNVSFVGTEALVEELGGKGDGTIITEVVPSPTDASLPIVKQYQTDMKAAGQNEFGYVSLEGYVDALVLVEILKKAGRNLTRDSFISSAEGLSFSSGGMKFSFSPAKHEALDKIYMTKVSGSKTVPVPK
ncbi:MAG: ABC transporter substrate-binding protein [Thermodesulfovibrionales bacterium]|nr:ABC transporter substrate-binding protein [Thermodesulfovibrionales bacterium]